MANALSIAALSMSDDMARLAVLSNNLANAATPGFKRDMAVGRPFVDFVHAATPQGASSWASTLPLSRSWTDLRAGAMQHTGHGLDVAIEGDGYFEIDDPGGPVYTRQGSFQVDASGRLVDAAGRMVAGTGGEIRVESSEPRIDRQGRVYDRDKLAGQLRIVRFEAPQALVKLGAGQFAAADQAALPVADAQVRQGYLEASNVTTAHEMVRLIETMRHFESNQKLIQGYDEMLERTIRTLGEF